MRTRRHPSRRQREVGIATTHLRSAGDGGRRGEVPAAIEAPCTAAAGGTKDVVDDRVDVGSAGGKGAGGRPLGWF
jgi:hypothetical protein